MPTEIDILDIQLAKSAYFYKIKDGQDVNVNTWNDVCFALKGNVVQPAYNFVKTAWSDFVFNDGSVSHYGLCALDFRNQSLRMPKIFSHSGQKGN